jgi:DEAD/DEAH box helicase domain-containing protein
LTNKDKIVLDLETQDIINLSQRENLSGLRVSLVGIYSYREDAFHTYKEDEVPKLLPRLKEAELLIGFNIKHFDLPVLEKYFQESLKNIPVLDILEEVTQVLGHRLSLDSLAQATLGIGKSGNGLDAVKYFKAGNWEKLISYCQQDVKVTRDLYEYGLKYGHLIYQRAASLEIIPISWSNAPSTKEILETAFRERQSIEIEYSSTNPEDGSQRKWRKVDIYDFAMGQFIAFCHLRKDLRTFNLRRVLSVKKTAEHYQIPVDFKAQEFWRQKSIGLHNPFNL